VNKNILSKKHGTCLFIIILLYILTVIFKTNTIYLPVLNIILCLLLIHYYLREPFFSYGLSFKKIHIQIICGLLLAAIILFYLYGNAFTWNIYPFVIGRFMRHFSSYPALWFYFFNIFARALYEEITFRGIFLSFFQRIFTKPLVSIVLCAILSGAADYLVGQDILRAVLAVVTGFIYGYLRINEPEKFTVFSLSLAHFLQIFCTDIIEFW